MQINRETQNLASLLSSNTNFNQQSSPHHHNAPALLSPFFGVCILVWIDRETQDFASLLFSTNKFKSTFLTLTSQRASLVVCVFFATRIIVEKKRHTTHRKLTENRVYPDSIYFASVYADFSAYA